jgi:hypothetical protein
MRGTSVTTTSVLGWSSNSTAPSCQTGTSTNNDGRAAHRSRSMAVHAFPRHSSIRCVARIASSMAAAEKTNAVYIESKTDDHDSGPLRLRCRVHVLRGPQKWIPTGETVQWSRHQNRQTAV